VDKKPILLFCGGTGSVTPERRSVLIITTMHEGVYFRAAEDT
jgi:hypothetical protein